MQGRPKRFHLLLLAKTTEGYHNLLKIVSESHVDNFRYKPLVMLSQLKKYGHGIIASSACIAGIIPKLLDNGQFDDAVKWAKTFAACFDEGDFYIELQNQGKEVVTDAGKSQPELNRMLVDVANAAGLKTIATNDFHYLLREDAPAQDLMLCVGMQSTVNEENRMRFPNDQFYMKTEEEMREAMRGVPRGLRQHGGGGREVRRGAVARPHPAAVPAARGRKRGKLVPQARAGRPGKALRHAGARARAEAGRLRDVGHHPAGLPRILPHRAGIHRMGPKPGHRRGSRPRFGRRCHRGLRHGHHRP